MVFWLALAVAALTPRVADGGPSHSHFGPGRRDREMLKAFTEYHGRERVASYFDEKKRLAPSNYE